MALERHVVELSARDTLTPVLKNVGREAENAGRKAEDAGKRATKSTQDWGRAASAVGLALGTGIGVAIKVFNEAEVVQTRLRQSVENTGAAYEEYADSIDKASDAALKLAFDDEDALSSIAALTDATGNAQTAITDLALAEDIARGRGIDLAAATNIVIAAETGRFASLKRLGIVVDENASKEEVLASLQAKYAGQAQAYAQTNAATWDRVQNTIENALERVGGALADYQGLILAVAASGSTLGPLADAFTALGGKAKLASVASNALSLAMSPAGLLGITTALTAGMVYLVATTDEFTASAQAAERESADLANSYAALAASIEDVTEREKVRQTYAEFSGLQEQAQKDLRTYEELQNAIVEWQSEFPQMQDVAIGALTSINEETQNWLDFNHDGRLSIDELTQAYDQFGEKALITTDQAHDITKNLTEALAHADVNVTKVLADYNALEQQWLAGEITGQQFADGVEDINQHWGDYTQYTLEATVATQNLTQAMDGWFAVGARHKAEVAADADAMKDWVKGQTNAGHAITDNIDVIVKQEHALDGAASAYDTVDRNAVSAATGFDTAATAAVGVTDATIALDQQLDALSETLKADLPGAASAAYQRVVGFTSGMVGAIKTSRDWADALIAPVGTFSELDNMLASGAIDIEDYNEAQQAQVDITNDLARATAAANIIQVKQADTVADGADATADYLEYLAALPEAQQAIKLAWADTDVAGQAMEIANLTASFGDMNDAQQTAFENMVESAANTNPALALVLSDMKLIEEQADGTYELKVPTDNAKSSTEVLIDTMNHLINTINGIPDVTVAVTADTSQFWAAYQALPTFRSVIDIVTGNARALGGVIPYPDTSVPLDTAALGRVSSGTTTLVGEHGPELVSLPGGSHVLPNHATEYDKRARGRGGDLIIQNMTVVANDPQTFMRQMRQYTTTMERR